MPIKYNRGWLVVRGQWNADEIERLGLVNRREIKDGKPIKHIGYGPVILPVIQRIKLKIGINLRNLLSLLNVYI